MKEEKMEGRPAALLGVILVVASAGFAHGDEPRNTMSTPTLLLARAHCSGQRVVIGGAELELPPYECASLRLTNNTSGIMSVEHTVSPLDSFIPIVRHQNGEVISTGAAFGVTASVLTNDRVTTIAPSASANFQITNPFETVPPEKLKYG